MSRKAVGKRMSESIQAPSIFVEHRAPFALRHEARPTAREWIRHTALFLLTALTATVAGAWLVGNIADPDLPVPHGWLDYIVYIPEFYLTAAGSLVYQTFTHPVLLAQGAIFAAALLAILAAHEAGHYIACRRYGVKATLPFFIPAPPLFAAGTFGAFIKIQSPIPSRRALFDIGVAGPLAGFIVAVPVALAGILMLRPAPPVLGDAINVNFNDPLLFRIVAHLFGVQLAGTLSNPFYMAAWFGLLVTSLNLMPVGQLDGGHATYAAFGAHAHRRLGRVAFVVMAALSVLNWTWHGSPSGFLYVVLLAILLRVRHPQAQDETEPLDRPRLLVAIFTLVVFALSFWPFPITIS